MKLTGTVDTKEFSITLTSIKIVDFTWLEKNSVNKEIKHLNLVTV